MTNDGDGDGELDCCISSTTTHPGSPECTKQYAFIALAHAIVRSQPSHMQAACVHGDSSRDTNGQNAFVDGLGTDNEGA